MKLLRKLMMALLLSTVKVNVGLGEEGDNEENCAKFRALAAFDYLLDGTLALLKTTQAEDDG